MNTGSLNSSTLNGTSSTAEDATLTGGLTLAQTFAAAFAISAVLSGGMAYASTLEANQYTAPTLTDGVSSAALLDASYHIDSKPNGGLGTNQELTAKFTYAVTDGVSCTNVLDALYKLDNRSQGGLDSYASIDSQFDYALTGGIHQTSNAYGNVAALATGGVHQTAKLGGSVATLLIGGLNNITDTNAHISLSFTGLPFQTKATLEGLLYIPITLPFGITKTCELGGDLYWKPGQYGGVENAGEVGGGITRDHILTTDFATISTLDARYTISPELDGGLFSTSVFQSNTHFNARLQGGIALTNNLEGGIPTGRLLKDGVSTNATLDAKWFYDCKLTGGIVNFHEVGGEVDTNIVLQGGIVTVCTSDYNLIIGSELDGGITRFDSLNSELVSSPKLIGGSVASTSLVDALYRIDAAPYGGTDNTGLLGSTGLTANSMLTGAIESASAFDATFDIDCAMNGGESSSGFAEAQYRIDFVGSAGLSNTQELNAAYKFDAALPLTSFESNATFDAAQDISFKQVANFATNNNLDSWLIASPVLSGGVLSSSSTDAALAIIPPVFLIGGVHSDARLTDVDIASFYGDMLHNTWQLEITSATELLEISTPIGDS